MRIGAKASRFVSFCLALDLFLSSLGLLSACACARQRFVCVLKRNKNYKLLRDFLKETFVFLSEEFNSELLSSPLRSVVRELR